MTVRLPKGEDRNISDTEDIARIMQKVLRRQNKLHRNKEYFWTIGLNTSNDIEYIELVTIGSNNRMILVPVDVFSFTVAKKCKKIIFCHNHPSGNLVPSRADIEFTRDMDKAAGLLGIVMLDHLIISEEDYSTIEI
ncbi:JAB domain-containing protein [Flagellimonas meridianipacifica]|uniref:RadC-like JAB domain-containing protein n=1 Tax=Flagellimonas meridianipacifica TaxID=1080225 RepID=A0A2T0MGJ1_9FLAO|nr:JAB domain-containing protein [Allomuricauda pacifica]PRX56674.1 RadC-like JAB domain-containing protein [Allomuricauda pacifica]